jgi:hypothetical protein
MRHMILGNPAMLVWFSPLVGDPPDQPKPQTPAEQYKALVEAHRRGSEEFNKAYQSAQTDEERQKVLKELGRPSSPHSHAASFLKLIQAYPKDSAAFEAFRWLLLHDPSNPDTRKAMESIAEHHIQSADMASVCQRLAVAQHGDSLLRLAIEKSPHRDVQGQARYGLALYWKRQAETAANRGPKVIDEMNGRAEKLIEEVAANYADLKYYQSTLGKEAEAQLFELRHLAIGKQAPEIEGEDIDGQRFKLSDYRGKAVLLDFWGHW